MQQRQRRPRARGAGLVRGLSIVLVLLVVAILLVSRATVRELAVQGNSYRTDNQVIVAAGIELGENMLFLDEGKIRDRINTDRYLEYRSIWRDFASGRVTITVLEHTPLAKMVWMGTLVLIGDDGIVLEETASINSAVHIPEIVGMTPTQVRSGQPVQYGVAGQGEAITRILEELTLQSIAGEVIEINIASPDNIQLIMENGLQVTLGNDELLPQKLALVRDVMPQVSARWSTQGGILDVSTGRMADFRPPQ